jgi:hypothetical protein
MIVVSAGPQPGLLIGSAFGALPLCLFTYPVSAWVDRKRLNRIRAEAAKGLGMLAVPHSAGSLAVGMQDGARNVREACRESLVQVLPTLTDAQYGRLPLDTTPRLCTLLHQTDEPVLLGTLRALRAVGDSRALDAVGRLLHRIPAGWQNSEMATEAQLTFEVLMARRKREMDAASLLRPTDSPLAPENELLRPYVQSGDHPAENLLRAAGDE